MLKITLITLTFLSLSLPAGDSAGNGGNAYEGLLQKLVRTRVKAALKHEKNKTLLSDDERQTLERIIDKGLPIKVVVPEKLEEGRYVDILGEETIVRADEKGRVRLVDNGKDVARRLVQDTKTRKMIIQWDEQEVKEASSEHLAREVARDSITYVFAMGNIGVNDEDGVISKKLYLPESDPSLLLPSAAYRYDFSRRITELLVRRVELVQRIKDAKMNHSRLTQITNDQVNQIKVIRKLRYYPIKANDEGWADNFDLAERNLALEEIEVREIIGKKNGR